MMCVVSLYIYVVNLEKALHYFFRNCYWAVVVQRLCERILGMDIIKNFVHVGFWYKILFDSFFSLGQWILSRDVTAKQWIIQGLLVTIYMKNHVSIKSSDVDSLSNPKNEFNTYLGSLSQRNSQRWTYVCEVLLGCLLPNCPSLY
jgi:hypothetical protein